MPGPRVPRAADDPVGVVHPALDLVNSDHGGGLGYADVLEQPGWLPRYLTAWDVAPTRDPNPGDLRRLRELRALLRRIVERLDADEPATADELDTLNGFLGGRRVSRRLAPADGGYRVELLPERRDWSWTLAEIAASFADLLAGGEAARVKVCDNPDCRFAYYDETKNRSRRWCAQAVCGNRHRVRRFRERRARDEA